jgi:hypothetical protein
MASRRLAVANITLQSSQWDYDEQVKFSGRSFRLVRIGTNGDLKKAEDLVWQWSLKADAIAVSGIREARRPGSSRVTSNGSTRNCAGARRDRAKARRVETSQGLGLSSGGRGLLVRGGPGDGLVVEGAGFQAAVQDADEPVGQLP